ncbi:MAG: sulfatase [Kiritimatiellae bacterium]|nr:sulfatase [Kiritimatiellia bacterium]
MKILWIDIDTLRADHLGCYGYLRNTSPNIDRVAGDGVRFEHCYVSDAPCLPSRAALHHGRFGIHTGAMNHCGAYADPYKEGPTRGFKNSAAYRKFVEVLQKGAGLYTGTVSSFAGRHSSWWFLAGFNDVYDCGRGGGELASEVTPRALEWLERNGSREDWFFHFNCWDPHRGYRTPREFGNPFQDAPIEAWITQELIDTQLQTYGTRSAILPRGRVGEPGPREVERIRNLDDYKIWIDGYDTGINYADQHVGGLFAKLDELGLYDETAIIISSDHGENQGELNVYGDHHTADLITSRVPMLVKWPGVKPRVDSAFHYQFDIAATVLELLEQEVPAKWDGESFKDALLAGADAGRECLVVSQAAWSCQRSVIWDDFILIRTYMDGLKDWPELMLFNWREDPHELQNLAGRMPGKVQEGLARLQQWLDAQMRTADVKEDPMLKIIDEGGPCHTRGRLPFFIEFFNSIGKPEIAKRMQEKYGRVWQYNERS